MGNLITSMWTAVSGFTTSQSGINTTAHNIANVNTKGYTRQQMMSTDAIYTTIASSSGTYKVGLGANVEQIRQLRNEFYDASYRKEYSREGFYHGQYETIFEMEELFGEMEGVSFQDTLDNIWVSMEELSKQPESLTTRTTFVNNVYDFINRAEDIYQQLESYQEDINISVKNTVDRINELGQKIFELNKKISEVEASRIEHANDYRDTRNSYIDELANLIQIDYKEEADGKISVVAEGSIFISDFSVNKIVLETVNEKSNILVPKWKQIGKEVFNADKFDEMSDYDDTGFLKGLVMARGTYASNYTDIPKAPIEPEYPMRTDYVVADENGKNVFNQAEYDAAVKQYEQDYQEYKIEFSKYVTAVDEYNNTVGVSSIMSVMSGFDNLIHGVVTQVNNILCPNKEIEIVNVNGEVETITVLDEERAPIGTDENKTQGEELIKRKSVERYVTESVTTFKLDENGEKVLDANGNPVTEVIEVRRYQEENDKKSTQYTLGEIEINKKITDNYSVLPLSENSKNGNFSYEKVVVELINIWDEPFATLDPNTLTVYTFGEYYNAFIGDIGNTGEMMKGMMESQSKLKDSIEAQRNSYSGVSSDEEVSNLVKYQHAYNAASRYFNVINSMLDTIMTMLG